MPLGIFWDYENCPIPPKAEARVVFQNLLSVLAEYGPVELFNIYSKAGLVRRLDKFSSTVQDAGGKFIDCTHPSRKKEVVDHRILVDTMTFVMDQPSKEGLAVALITGDGDFVHAVEQMKSRGCKVILILPNAQATSSRLRAVASTSLSLATVLTNAKKSHQQPTVKAKKKGKAPQNNRSYSTSSRPNQFIYRTDAEDEWAMDVDVDRSRAPSPEAVIAMRLRTPKSSQANPVAPARPIRPSWATFCDQINQANATPIYVFDSDEEDEHEIAKSLQLECQGGSDRKTHLDANETLTHTSRRQSPPASTEIPSLASSRDEEEDWDLMYDGEGEQDMDISSDEDDTHASRGQVAWKRYLSSARKAGRREDSS